MAGWRMRSGARSSSRRRGLNGGRAAPATRRSSSRRGRSAAAQRARCVGRSLVGDDRRDCRRATSIEFLPPVSRRMSIVAQLEAHALDPQLELAELIEQARGNGAIVSFVGLARPESRRRCGRCAGARTSSDADPAIARGYRGRLRRAVRRQPCARGASLRNDSRGRADRLRRRRIASPPRGVRRRRLSDGPAQDRGGVLEARGRRRRRRKWIEPTEADLAERDRWG